MTPPAPPTPASSPWWADPLGWVELFLLANLAFLGVDIAVAHAINAFANPAEWVPLGYSAAGSVVLAGSMLLGGLRPTLRGQSVGSRTTIARWLSLAVGWGAVIVGVVGLLLHLESQFFDEMTLKNLVYTAPFVAPLAYTGLGLLAILDRMVPARSVEWARWVVLLALGGFVGNFVLTLADHAQNGFFHPTEWVGVVASAVAVGALTALVALPADRPLRGLVLAIMAAQVVVGLLGAYLHVRANLAGPMETLREDFLYGAPAFAPLLFANLALLATLGVWGLARAPAEAPAGSAPGLAAAGRVG